MVFHQSPNRWASPVARFWANVNKDGPIHPVYGQCWIWTGAPTEQGYAKFRAVPNQFQRVFVHRYSWVLHYGEIPTPSDMFYEGDCVLHRCDNRICVNPVHLFLGDRDANMADRQEKERQARGESSGRAKLTDEEVREIRRLYRRGKRGCGVPYLAKKFGVARTTIEAIVNNRTWVHLLTPT